MTPAERAELVRLDRAHVWQPYDVGEDEARPPLVVARAEGSWLVDADGRRVLDGNASWWTSALGHAHPRLVRALARQAETLDHVALAGVVHEPAARLAAELAATLPGDLAHVFYTDDGSTALEAAVRMSVQLHANEGRPARTRFLALERAYHGDTLAPSMLGGLEVFRRPVAGLVVDCVRAPVPEAGGHEAAFEALERLVVAHAHELAAVVVEPIVQGAAGMRTYPPALLARLADVARRHGALLVADEVFTGFGRTGPMWAVEHAGVVPDLVCLGKALGSILPLGAVVATPRVRDAFRGGLPRTFLYGHTFCGNPLGTAVAREVLAVYRDEDVLARARPKAARIAQAFDALAQGPGVRATRSLGMIGAADLGGAGYAGDLGWRVYDEALRRGVYLRPLGDTVYVCPPLVIDDADLERLLDVVAESVTAATR